MTRYQCKVHLEYEEAVAYTEQPSTVLSGVTVAILELSCGYRFSTSLEGLTQFTECDHDYAWTDMTGEYVCTKCHTPRGTDD